MATAHRKIAIIKKREPAPFLEMPDAEVVFPLMIRFGINSRGQEMVCLTRSFRSNKEL